MKKTIVLLSGATRPILSLGLAALLVGVFASRGESQNGNLIPLLQAGFQPDPYAVNVMAGGARQVKVDGVRMWVSNTPDFSFDYQAGTVPLTFYVRSRADTTLLIRLPNGNWIADDDSDGNLNPAIKLRRPPSGRYDVWVGTVQPNNAAATLYITELR
jgi:hypothetical protein